MATRTAPPHSTTGGPSRSRYERAWTTVTLLVCSAWVAVAVVQTPLVPLLGLAAGLGGYGGIFFVREPASTRKGRRQYVDGALLVAGAVLVIVGFRHHLELGLATCVVLTGSAPAVVRWVAGS
jgi:hypothetical protein